MTKTDENALTFGVCEYVTVSEDYFARSCLFFLRGAVSVGYQYIETEDSGEELSPGFEMLFEETLAKLEAKGVHLSL